MLEPLRIRDFALLWTGMSVSLLGDAIFLVALAWQTYELSDEPSALGWVLAAYTAPMVVFLLAGGVLTDRIERRKMMIAADAVRALAVGTAAALALSGGLELWHLAACAAVTGVGDALFAPAFGSIVPEIVPRELLAQANALDQFVRPVAGIAGPALAGVLIATSGAGLALAVDAATFGASTVTALLLTPRPFERRPGRSARRDLREVFSFVRARTWLWATLAIAGLLNVAPSARNVLLPFVVKNDLRASAGALGAVYSATAAGALVSALVYGQRGLPRRYVLAMYLGWGGATLVIAGYGLATGVWQLVVLGFLAGIGLALGMAIWGTMMHRLVPRELLGRVTSVDWMLSTALMPVSMVGVGFLGDAIGARATLVAAGLFGGVLTIAFVLLVPGLREPEREDAASGALGEPARERV
jgi:DHA3 family tetracycline resistance protein-like MFS transporter